MDTLFPATAAFFNSYAQRNGHTEKELRQSLERAQLSYLELGSYMKWFDLFKAQLRKDLAARPALRHRAGRALTVVFNLDSQAVVEAFYYDTFASMSVDLAAIKVDNDLHALSGRAAQLKGAVQDRLDAVAQVSVGVRGSSEQVARSSEEASRAVTEVATAMTGLGSHTTGVRIHRADVCFR